jgi:hypothetical protein
MSRFLAVCLAAATSFAASAIPIGVGKTILEVEYWGTVTRVDGPIETRIGDPIHGLLHIDPSLAPPGPPLGGPTEAQYIWNAPCDRKCPPRVPAPSGFVTSYKTVCGGDSDDQVHLFNGNPPSGRFDAFIVENNERGPGHIYQLSVGALAPLDLLHELGISQEFDTRPADSGGSGSGRLEEIFQSFANRVDFIVERLRVSPKVCRS